MVRGDVMGRMEMAWRTERRQQHLSIKGHKIVIVILILE
jgi:hypothetical protein